MFDIGFGELLLLIFLFLILFGPDKLPEIAKKSGEIYSKIRKDILNFKVNVEKEIKLEELRRINNIPDDVKEIVLSEEEIEKRKRELLEKRKKSD